MVITASWLTGFIIGLWLENLDRNIGVGLGLFCYYSVYALVSNIYAVFKFYSRSCSGGFGGNGFVGRTLLHLRPAPIQTSGPNLLSREQRFLGSDRNVLSGVHPAGKALRFLGPHDTTGPSAFCQSNTLNSEKTLDKDLPTREKEKG